MQPWKIPDEDFTGLVTLSPSESVFMQNEPFENIELIILIIFPDIPLWDNLARIAFRGTKSKALRRSTVATYSLPLR